MDCTDHHLLVGVGAQQFARERRLLNKRGQYAGVSMYRAGETKYAVCAENGAEAPELEPLLPGAPED